MSMGRPLGLSLVGWVVAVGSVGTVMGADPKATVDLVAGSSAVAPGTTIHVAFTFRLQPGWHIYWRDAGASGYPPKVTWKLPTGFEAGPLRFPGPTRHSEAGGRIITNVLEGTPVLTAEILAPESIQATEVTLEAALQWLVCKDVCIPETASLKLSLPVVASPDEVKPAHEDVFAAVARTHPAEGGRGKYLTATASTTKAEVAPGDSFDLVVALSVKKGFHVQSHTPTIEGLIPTEVVVARPPGLTFGDTVYPAPVERVDKQLGKLSEYQGDVQVRIPVTVEKDISGDRAEISGLVRYQACDEKTAQCFPPEYVAWGTTILIAGGAPVEKAEKLESTATTMRPQDAATLGDEPTGAEDEGGIGGFLGGLGLPGLLLGCFLYGLFLNATPCVFPLLSIKVLGFVQQAHESRGRTFVLGLVFGVGVVVFFVILGFLASRGQNVLQYPAAAIALGAVVLALALSMLGVYNLQPPAAATKLDAVIRQEGMLSSFGKGALAPVLGFACTGPLLAGAFGWATQQPPVVAFAAFLVTGFGMASPYMLLGANPKWLSFLPRPGQWMITFERIMGFLLLAMVIWLLSPLVAQIGAGGLEWTFAFLVSIGMACWILGRIDLDMPAAQRWRYRGGALGVVLCAGSVIYGWVYPLGEAQAAQRARLAEAGGATSGIAWQAWSDEAVENAVRSGKTVFVDFTAAWCTVCKANKKLAINTDEVRDKLAALEAVAFQADFTFHDADIAAAMQKHGRAGPPLNVLYPAGKPDSPIVLRPNLTKRYLLEKLDEAGPSSAGTTQPK